MVVQISEIRASLSGNIQCEYLREFKVRSVLSIGLPELTINGQKYQSELREHAPNFLLPHGHGFGRRDVSSLCDRDNESGR